MSDTSTAQVQGPQPVQSKTLRVLAYIVSFVLHPIFIPAGMAFALYKLAPVSFAGITPPQFYKWLASIIINTLFFPLFTVLLLKGLGFVQSIHLRTPKERIIPLIATMIFYFWAAHIFNSLAKAPGNSQVPPLILRVLMTGSYWSIIAMFVINIFFKISMHTTGMGGLIGILIVLMIVSPVNMVSLLFIALVIAGLAGTARMLLGMHRMWEIWAGYILGTIVMLAAYFYLK